MICIVKFMGASMEANWYAYIYISNTYPRDKDIIKKGSHYYQ